jgi:copper(I)-binding protein
MRSFAVAFVLAAVVAGAAAAQTPAPAGVAVEAVWARATPPGAKTGAVYLTLVNNGAADDRLVGVSTPVADRAQLHVESNDNGVMRMRPLAAVDVKPGAHVTFKPGGMHVMLLGLKRQLKEGDRFPLALDFAKAGRREVLVAVAKAGAMGIQDHSGMRHDIDHMDQMDHMDMKHP